MNFLRSRLFIFGLKVEEIEQMRNGLGYNPWGYYNQNPNIKRVMDSIGSDMFCSNKPGLFKPIYDSIMHAGDYYFHLADFQPYVDTQEKVSREYTDGSLWAKKAILNVVRTGKFSLDRTISE